MTASRILVITDPLGLHARPAAAFVEKARTFASDLTIDKAGKAGNCKSLLSILKLGISQGTTVTLTGSGADEQAAVDALVAALRGHTDGAGQP